jgi:ABC-type branched-subunit amino acid transport system substrate-binding protein
MALPDATGEGIKAEEQRMRIGFARACLLAACVLHGYPANAEIKVGIVISASGPGSALAQPQLRMVAAHPDPNDVVI